MKETYKVKVPKHIKVGDPWYFKQYSGSELERLTVDNDIPSHLTEARVTLEAEPCKEMPELTLLDMTLYIAPKQTIDTYLSGMMYPSQEIKPKEIGVDTARYILAIGDKSQTVYTGADGGWGCYSEFKHKDGNNKLFDAIILQVGLSSDFDDMDSMRKRLHEMFADVEQIENFEVPDEDESEDESMNIGGMNQ